MQISEAARQSQTILDTLQQVIIGKEQVLQHLLLGLYSRGNILIEDFPGLAKTLIARLIAQVTGLEFKRIQFTPDLLPGDITGGLIYNQRRGEFEFRPGPLFTNLVLADEVNRAPPKTQAALLEVMQERQVTVEGTTPISAIAVRGAGHAKPYRTGGDVSLAGSPTGPLYHAFACGLSQCGGRTPDPGPAWRPATGED